MGSRRSGRARAWYGDVAVTGVCDGVVATMHGVRRCDVASTSRCAAGEFWCRRCFVTGCWLSFSKSAVQRNGERGGTYLGDKCWWWSGARFEVSIHNARMGCHITDGGLVSSTTMVMVVCVNCLVSRCGEWGHKVADNLPG